MKQNQILARLPEVLLPWYRENMRQLPWRQDREPYHVWVSEIMLQQTRVEAVKEYYKQFLTQFPTVMDLAEADDDLLQKMWEGLGYYSRVRNMKKTAKTIMQEYGGHFPREHNQILALPGIGPYTAGAICSIAYDLPTPGVDGNVLRVVSRLLNNDTPVDSPGFKKMIQSALTQIYPPQAGEFTQSLMELGATICGPNRKPDCPRCPCQEFCLGYKSGRANALPVKLPKKSRRMEEKTVLILSCDGCYALEKRPSKGLLAGLWQFPNLPGKLSAQQALREVEKISLKPKQILCTVERKHIFTHIEWRMCGVYVEVEDKNDCYAWFTREQLEREAAIPTAFRQFYEQIDKKL